MWVSVRMQVSPGVVLSTVGKQNGPSGKVSTEQDGEKVATCTAAHFRQFLSDVTQMSKCVILSSLVGPNQKKM